MILGIDSYESGWAVEQERYFMSGVLGGKVLAQVGIFVEDVLDIWWWY